MVPYANKHVTFTLFQAPNPKYSLFFCKFIIMSI